MDKKSSAQLAAYRKIATEKKKASRHRQAEAEGRVVKPRFSGDLVMANKDALLDIMKEGLTGVAPLADLPIEHFEERYGGPIPHTFKFWGKKQVFSLPFFEDKKSPRNEAQEARMRELDDGVVVFLVGPANATLHVVAIFSTYTLADRLLGLAKLAISHSLCKKGALKGRINGADTKAGGRYYVRAFLDPL